MAQSPSQKTGQKPQESGLSGASPMARLLAVMAKLRDPNGGCPWDLEQDFKSIAPYTIEEAYEVADAIDRDDMDGLKEELGDLLLQAVYHAQMASEAGLFTFDDVAGAVADKMISRHPHVFGDQKARSAADVNAIWDARKDAEKTSQGALDGVTKGLPALLRAQKLQKKAGKTGFEWPDTAAAFAKLEEEIAEFKEALSTGSVDNKVDEFGDVLFCVVNYGRLAGIDAEEALRQANAKFEKRFRGMEADLAARGMTFRDMTLDQLLDLWKDQKRK